METFDKEKSDNETGTKSGNVETFDLKNKDNDDDPKNEVEREGEEGFGDYLEESGFIFEAADRTKSKLFRHPGETTEADSDEDTPKAETEKKDHKENKSSPADSKHKKKRKNRSSPKGTDEKKKEKRSKN